MELVKQLQELDEQLNNNITKLHKNFEDFKSLLNDKLVKEGEKSQVKEQELVAKYNELRTKLINEADVLLRKL